METLKMIDFVKELTACHLEGTEYPFYPERIKGYTEPEVELIAQYYNINALEPSLFT